MVISLTECFWGAAETPAEAAEAAASVTAEDALLTKAAWAALVAAADLEAAEAAAPAATPRDRLTLPMAVVARRWAQAAARPA